jgi:hypothetical protein
MSQGAAEIDIIDGTGGLFTSTELWNIRWAVNYWGKYQFNWSPWVMHGYDVFAFGSVGSGPNSWKVELLTTSDQPGALGYHENAARQSTPHSTRGLAAASGLPLAKIFVQTAREAGIPPTEVLFHEIAEALVDPWVNEESRVRKYLRNKFWYIAEVGDPVQGRAYDLGAPYGRTTGIMVSDFAYPSWWRQKQGRAATSIAADLEIWRGGHPSYPRLEPFELAPEGYMSIAPEHEPENWSQIYGSRAQRHIT